MPRKTVNNSAKAIAVRAEHESCFQCHECGCPSCGIDGWIMECLNCGALHRRKRENQHTVGT